MLSAVLEATKYILQNSSIQIPDANDAEGLRSLNDSSCDITPDGKPIQIPDDIFVSVHPASNGWSNPNPDGQELAERYMINCTVTKRISAIPTDRRKNVFIDQLRGIEPLCRDIMIALHQNMSILSLINDGTLTGYDAIEACRRVFLPLTWINTDAQPRIVGPEWYHTHNRPNSKLDAGPIALVMTVRFKGPERTQNIIGTMV